MKKSMLFAGCLSFAAAFNASASGFSFDARLISFSLFSAGGVESVGTVEQPTYLPTSYLSVEYWGPGLINMNVGMSLAPSYHRVTLPDGTEATYAGFTQYVSNPWLPGSGATHVTATFDNSSSSQWGIGSWCTSPQASACSNLYSENLVTQQAGNRGSIYLDLVFDDTSLSHFTGTAILTTGLSNGGRIERTYSLAASAVPLPMSGMLFGSAVLALAGARRRAA